MSIPPLNLIINLGVNMLKFINLAEVIIDFINNDESIKSIKCDYDMEGKPSYMFSFRNGYKVGFANREDEKHLFRLQTYGLEFEEDDWNCDYPKTIGFVGEADLHLVKLTCYVVSRYNED